MFLSVKWGRSSLPPRILGGIKGDKAGKASSTMASLRHMLHVISTSLDSDLNSWVAWEKLCMPLAGPLLHHKYW